MTKNKTYKKGKYMVGTTALHHLGDISRPKGDLCFIWKRKGEHYIGNWVTGLGFIDVRFPVATTRPLTAEEKSRWDGKTIGIPGSWHYKLKL